MSPTGTLRAGEMLIADQAPTWANGPFVAIMQADGNSHAGNTSSSRESLI